MRRFTSSTPHPDSSRRLRAGRLLVSLGVVAALVLSACGGGGSSGGGGSDETSEASGPVELTIWVSREQYMPTDQFMTTWKQKHPNITIKAEVQADDSLFTQLQRMMQAKQPLPDLVQLDSFYAPPMFESGAAIDLTPLVDRWKNEDAALLAKQAPAMMYKLDGKIIALSTTGTMDLLYYRADWLKEAGVKVPFTSWDQVLDALRAVKQKHPEIIPWSMVGTRGDGVNYLITQMTNSGVEFKGATPQLDTDAGRYVISFYQTLVREGLTSKEVLGWGGNESRGAWIGGQSAMMIENIRESNDFGKALEEGPGVKYPDGWDMVLPPLATTAGSAPVGKYSTATRTFQITSTSTHPYEASLVLRHMLETDVAMEASKSGAVYLQNEVLDSPEFRKIYPFVSPEQIDAFQNGASQPASARMFAIVEVLERMMQDIINNPNAPTEDLAKKWQAELDSAGN